MYNNVLLTNAGDTLWSDEECCSANPPQYFSIQFPVRRCGKLSFRCRLYSSTDQDR